MVKITAATPFLGKEGMWRPGDTREVSDSRAAELIELGCAIEAQPSAELTQHPLQPVADAIGATIGGDVELPEVPGIEDGEKEDKPAAIRATKEQKDKVETKSTPK